MIQVRILIEDFDIPAGESFLLQFQKIFLILEDSFNSIFNPSSSAAIVQIL